MTTGDLSSFTGGVKRRDREALLLEVNAVAPRAAFRVENLSTSGNKREEFPIQITYIEAESVPRKSCGVTLVIIGSSIRRVPLFVADQRGDAYACLPSKRAPT
jgi:hypothetical protein